MPDHFILIGSGHTVPKLLYRAELRFLSFALLKLFLPIRNVRDKFDNFEPDVNEWKKFKGTVHKLCSPKDDLLHIPYLIKKTTRGGGGNNCKF